MDRLAYTLVCNLGITPLRFGYRFLTRDYTVWRYDITVLAFFSQGNHPTTQVRPRTRCAVVVFYRYSG